MGRPRRNSEALQAVKWGIVVGAQESCAHGEGPEGEGREQYKGTQRTRKAVHGECSVELAKWTSPVLSLFSQPYEAKVHVRV